MEEIFREMLLRAWGQIETAFPPGIETQGGVEDVLRLVARMILALHKRPEYLGFPPHSGGRIASVSLDRRGVRRRHGAANRAARALSRSSDRDRRPRLQKSGTGR